MATHIDTQTLFARLRAAPEEIAAFCSRWNVTELALFGSVLRDDFNEQTSDIDVLVSFPPDKGWSYNAAFEMREELMQLFQRQVDLISKASLERSTNWIRKRDILASAQVIYVRQH